MAKQRLDQSSFKATQDSFRMIRMRIAPWQAVALYSPISHLAMYGGVGIGKSFSGSHFAIQHIIDFPDCTGLIGANTYDQLTQATLKELFYWLDFYGLEWVIDRMPPEEWGAPRLFKKYSNILSVRHPATKQTVHVLTRVLSKPNPIRGIELTWYWIDETRDTKQTAHDVLLGRMRESGYSRGLITTTTNGLSWDYNRFVLGADNKLYGAMHIPTAEAVRYGILTDDYFTTMKRSYSPLMALQELEAKHVNVNAGRAYYTAGEWNKMRRAPWGDRVPSKNRPLILGCDFNYSPAPHIWMVGQMGPDFYSSSGLYYGQCIHWFGEIARSQASTPDMATAVLCQYPDFFYRFFGDTSGQRGTTSNAGQHDYAQIDMTCTDAQAQFSIEVEWNADGSGKGNPRVKNRVENMNAKFRNALGEVQMTYNPDMCPHFDADTQMVGWKQTGGMRGEAKLDNAGDVNRTHATDGAGYAVWKLLPPMQRSRFIAPIPSQMHEYTQQPF